MKYLKTKSISENKPNTSKQSGFISTIILIVIALVILGYFNIDVRQVLISPGVQNNLNYAWGVVTSLFHGMIDMIVTFLSQYRQ